MSEESGILVNTEGIRYSYSASVFANAPAATPTDFWTLLGSASKAVRLLRLWVVGRATAATWYRVRLLKYSTAYAGGTGVAATLVPHDSTNPAATSVVTTWSGGLPTPGTSLGAVCDDDIPLQAATMTATQPFTGPPGLLYDFGIRNAQPIILRGTTQYVALNGNAVALPAGTVFDIKVEVVEDNS